MIPSVRLIILFALFSIPMLMGVWQRDIADLALIGNLILLAVAIADLVLSPAPHQIEAERKVSEVLSVGTNNPVELVLNNRSRRKLEVDVHSEPGDLCETEGLPQSVTLEPFKEESIRYKLRPLRRGPSELQGIHLRFRTFLGLWTRHDERELITPIRVYPDIRAVAKYELMAKQNRLSELGLRNQNMPGQGREFERLREYRYGDELRKIDWKATARKRELISREFDVERNQNLVVMVDCGRFMRNELDGVSYLDRALNAAIMLSYIALGQDDNVSLLMFSNKIERYIRPVRGKGAVQSLLRSTYDIQCSDKIADYSLALQYLTKVQRKRALVILITFVSDEMQLKFIGDHLQLRSLPYLPLCVLLQDVGLKQIVDEIPISDLEAVQASAAANMLTGRARKIASMRESGVSIIETDPNLLTEKVINEYLLLKSKNLI